MRTSSAECQGQNIGAHKACLLPFICVCVHVPCVCSLFMGNIELPGGATGSKQTIKMPVGTYEFGANLISEKGVRQQDGPTPPLWAWS